MKLLHWGMLVAAVALGAVAWSRWNTVEDERGPEVRLRDEQDRVKVKVELDPSCPKETPIKIAITNGSDHPLRALDFHLGVFEEGKDDDLAAGAPDEQLAGDVAPFATQSRCRAFPTGLPKRGARYFFRVDKRGGAMFR